MILEISIYSCYHPVASSREWSLLSLSYAVQLVYVMCYDNAMISATQELEYPSLISHKFVVSPWKHMISFDFPLPFWMIWMQDTYLEVQNISKYGNYSLVLRWKSIVSTWQKAPFHSVLQSAIGFHQRLRLGVAWRWNLEVGDCLASQGSRHGKRSMTASSPLRSPQMTVKWMSDVGAIIPKGVGCLCFCHENFAERPRERGMP